LYRQENLESLADKSSSLQNSANQFSHLASQVREDQIMQQYKFFAALGVTVLMILLFTFLWSSPGKLLIAIIIVSVISGAAFFYFQQKRQRTMRLIERINQRQRDPELGASVE
jgi:uncharacterized membrane protein